jgi:DNA-directed RNA polymerase III subunit RPC1
VRISEVEVSVGDLYKNLEDGRRVTAKDGPLDGRMVSSNEPDHLVKSELII